MSSFRHRIGAGPRVRHSLGFGLAIVVGAVALAACGSSNTNTVANQASASLGTVIYGTLPPTAPRNRRDDHAGPADRPDADLHLPDRPRREHVDRHDLVPELAVHAAVRGTDRRGAEGRREPERRQPADFSDGDRTYTIPIKPGLKWSNGAAGRRQRRRLLVRHPEGGDQGKPRQLGSVLPGPDAAEREEHLDEGQVRRRHAPDTAVQPRLLPQQQPVGHQQRRTRCRARRGTSTRPAGRT